MDISSLTVQEMKTGLCEDEKGFACCVCHARFEKGQVYPDGGAFYDAAHMAARHVEAAHGGTFGPLTGSKEKYNTLTDTQRNILAAMHEGLSDAEIAKRLGVAPATVRHQRFTFREKAKAARFYLAVYELAEAGTKREEALVAVHDGARQVDERFMITAEERAHILATAFESLEPLRLSSFSPKEKKKVAILGRICEEFEKGREYSHEELTEKLAAIYEDHATLRRYLVEYGFMDRTRDGKRYWLK